MTPPGVNECPWAATGKIGVSSTSGISFLGDVVVVVVVVLVISVAGFVNMETETLVVGVISVGFTTKVAEEEEEVEAGTTARSLTLGKRERE